MLHSIPNGGKRNRFEAYRLKCEGVLSGVPDLFLAYKTQNYGGLYLEAKFDDNKLTDNQSTVIERLRDSGYRVEVFYSLDEFKSIVNDYLK